MIAFSQLGHWGRLGNQMFEYAALVGIGEALGLEIAIPPLSQHQLGDVFELEARVLTRADRRRLRRVFRPSGTGYDPRWQTIRDGTDLRGFFQSWRYFPAEDRVRSALRFRREYRDAAAEVLGALRVPGRRLVGLTVRRGDYRLLPDQFVQLWATDYYERALAIVGGPDTTIVVSSDDPHWCRDRFAGRDVTVLGLDRPVGEVARTDVVEMLVLAGCDAVVGANSTFAWWATWLAGDDTTRIAPDRWFPPGAAYAEEGRDRSPEGWIELTV